MSPSEDKVLKSDKLPIDRMGFYAYGLIVSLNIFLLVLYIYTDKFLSYSIELFGAVEYFFPNCFASWSNASLEYKEVLFVVAPQSLLFSLLLAGTAFLRGLMRPELYSRRLYKAGSLEGVLISLVILWIWYCWMGSDSPISSYSDLGFVGRRLFGSPIGIVVVALVPSFLGLGIGMDVGRFFSGRKKS